MLSISYVDGYWAYFDATKSQSAPASSVSTGKFFYSLGNIDYIVTESGTLYQRSEAEKDGVTGTSYYFENCYTEYSYIADNTEDHSSEYSYRSHIYYDTDYKYYVKKNYVAGSGWEYYLYKENRSTGATTKLAQTASVTNIVLNGDYIYYVGTDYHTIYIMNKNETSASKYKTVDETLKGVYALDGYMYYETASGSTQLMALENAVTTGTYTLNNDSQKYNLEYIKTSRGVVISTCSGIDDADPTGEIYIPDTIEGLPVIGIGNYAFYFAQDLTGDLVLPSTVEYIGSYAFYKSKISSVTFNDGLKSIMDNAFNSCYGLSGTVDMPDSVTWLGNGAFYRDYKITGLKLSSGLTEIPGSTFYGCTSLTGTLEIPEGVQIICTYAFANTGYNSVIMPSTLWDLENAFWNCDITDALIKYTKIKYINSNINKYVENLYLVGDTTTSYADSNSITYIKWTDMEPVITLSQTSADLEIGESINLNYTVSPLFCDVLYDHRYISSNSNIVAVDSTGKVTAIKEGTATVTIKMQDTWETAASCKVTIDDSSTTFSLDYEEYQVNSLDETFTLNAITDTGAAANVTWSSSKPEVATVDSNGKVTPVSGGFVKIIATGTFNGVKVSQTCWVYVCTLITLSDGSQVYAGDLSPNGYFDAVDAAMILDIYKYGGDANAADVDGDGDADAVDAALVLDFYKYGSTFEPGSYTPITAVTLSESEKVVSVGKTLQLTATITPTVTTSSTNLTWTSSNEAVATVSDSGLVTMKSTGRATITVKTANGKTAKCVVASSSAILAYVDCTSISVTEKSVETDILTTASVTAVAMPETATTRTLSYSIENETIATIDSNGGITPLSVGSTNIIIQTTDGTNLKVTIPLTVSSLKISSIEMSSTEVGYTGEEQTPEVSVYNSDGEKLEEGTDYSYTYSAAEGSEDPDDLTNIGDKTITITGEGAYSGTVYASYTVSKGDNTLVISCDDVIVGRTVSPKVVTNSAGLEVTYVYKVSGSSEELSSAPTEVGTYEVYAYTPSTDNYNETVSNTVTFSITKNITLDDLFNATYYADRYTDLKAAFGYDSAKLKAHWLSNGIKEGRTASPVFDPKYYVAKYADIARAYGTDYTAIYNHFVNFGAAEGRQGSKYFDVTYYIENNSDVARVYNSNKILALKHYVGCGITEGRTGSSEFSVKTYKSEQTSYVQYHLGTDYIKYYVLDAGINLINDPAIDITDYLFDAKYYADKYADLKAAFGYDEAKLKNHYLTFGIKEGRSASPVFDPKYYVEKYADIARTYGTDYTAIYKHFIKNGINEGRQGSSTFNVKAYINNYADLQKVYGTNYSKALKHYMVNGINEGRTGV